MRAFVCGLVLLALPAAAGESPGPSKCSALQLKASGAYLQAQARCESKAVAKGVPVEAACRTAALVKLQKAFARAEKKGDCLVSGDSTAVADEAAGCIEDLANAVVVPLQCCAIPGGAFAECGWAEDAEACTARGGTLGADGTVCDGTAECIAPPATPGPCCERSDGCAMGSISPTGCTDGGGTFVLGAVCLPSGACAVAE